MKRLLLLSVPLALFAACPAPKKGCKETGCSAGSVCNTNTNTCELIGTSGGGGGTGGGGGGGGGGSVTGGGGGTTDAGFDAGPPVDPFDDGGTFVPGDICTYAIPVLFDGGVSADGGLASTTTLTVDLAAASNQYKADCNSSNGSSNDVIFEVTLTEPKGLVVTATDTSGKSQDAVLSLMTSPCLRLAQAACIDATTQAEVLSLDRVPAGTWYVLLENYASDNLDDGTYDVQFELTEPLPGPPNDSCGQAQALTFTSNVASVTGTTTGAFNDTAGAPLTCSSASARQPEVFYSFTLTQPQDVRVLMGVPTTSNLFPAVAITNTCGASGVMNQRGCATGSTGTFTARSVPAGTYFVVVDGAGSTPGDFTLEVTLLPATPLPGNDTCVSPTPLTPAASLMVDLAAATGDYTFSCGTPSGGDVVFQFSTTQAQRVVVTATGVGTSADAVLALRGGPCDSSADLRCANNEGFSAPEVLTVNNLPAGTYYVLLGSDGTDTAFGISLALEPPRPPPTNESCSAPEMVTLTAGAATRTVDLTDATADIASDLCGLSSDGGDVVYEVSIPAMQTLTVVATPVGSVLDPVLFAKTPTCAMATSEVCLDDGFPGDPETITVPNTTAAAITAFVVVKAYNIESPGEVTLTFNAQ